MKLTVIGHWGGFPKSNEASSGYLVEHDGFNLLMDCGSAVLSKLQTLIDPQALDAVILSHYHPDHVADIGVLQHALLIGRHLNGRESNLPIYGHSEDKEAFNKLTYKDITSGYPYNPDGILHIGPFSITFLKTKHPVPCYAMRVEAAGKVLVYTGDSSYQESFIEFSRGASVLLCESNFYKGMNGAAAGHMTSEEAGRLAQMAGAETLVLTHLPHFGDLGRLMAEAQEQFSGEVMLAEEGLTLSL